MADDYLKSEKEVVHVHNAKHVERYSFIERFTHLLHLISLFVLLITGFKIYFGWGFITYNFALYLHIIFAVFFTIANWIFIPYNVITSEFPYCSQCQKGQHNAMVHRIKNIMSRFLFGPEDIKRLKQIFMNFIGKAPYPAFTVYDVKNDGYLKKLHPITKLLLPLEGLAVFLVVITGIVIYNFQWTFLGLPIAKLILWVGGLFAPIFGLGVIPFMRIIHLLMAYFFIFEVIVHVGIIEMDPKVWKYHKAIFISGEEDLNDRNYVNVVSGDVRDR